MVVLIFASANSGIIDKTGPSPVTLHVLLNEKAFLKLVGFIYVGRYNLSHLTPATARTRSLLFSQLSTWLFLFGQVSNAYTCNFFTNFSEDIAVLQVARKMTLCHIAEPSLE